MPVYQAWIPVVAYVKTTLTLDGTLKEEGLTSKSDVIERFREDGETEFSVCPECKEHLIIEEGVLDFDEVDDNDVEVEKISD